MLLDFRSLVEGTAGSYVLTAETGHYAYSGSDADLVYSGAIDASGDAGGAAWWLSRLYRRMRPRRVPALQHYRLQADCVKLHLHLSKAQGRRVRNIVAYGGRYVSSGADAQLRYHRALAATTGRYTARLTDAWLSVDRRLVADVGKIQFRGSEASLSRSSKVLASSGSYSVSGGDARFLITSSLPLQASRLTYPRSIADEDDDWLLMEVA